ncbi:hypothetical protein CEXT_609501 [Caerostris extrusa]|uniref:Uncharacterized protein n=1 Tax=Caerostris extrusa TaxID=172846 RepID=A0AAV4PGJ5_CAEEX|nr:hypothetical protein CEXT_609501 [Caerostris extrusa]
MFKLIPFTTMQLFPNLSKQLLSLTEPKTVVTICPQGLSNHLSLSIKEAEASISPKENFSTSFKRGLLAGKINNSSPPLKDGMREGGAVKLKNRLGVILWKDYRLVVDDFFLFSRICGTVLGKFNLPKKFKNCRLLDGYRLVVKGDGRGVGVICGLTRRHGQFSTTRQLVRIPI